MSENTEAKSTQPEGEAAQATFAIVGQFAKDVSLECPKPAFAMGGEKINVTMDVAVGVRELEKAADTHETSLKLAAEAKDEAGEVRYLAEIEYAGVFKVQGVPKEHLAPLLSIDGAALLFPFARQILMDMIIASGYRPGMVEPINFQALYRQSQMQKEGKSA